MNANTVTSHDGTAIAYEKTGQGPAVVLVGSALADRSDTTKLAKLLAPRFTVINYDRRGRGASGDTQPYDVNREVDDIAALIDEAGGSAYVFGSSSGAVLALEAVARGVGITKLACYEPPFVVDAQDPRPPADAASHINKLVAAGRRGEAVTYFMTKVLGAPALLVAAMRLMPKTWSGLKAMVHTSLYDLAIMGDTQAGQPLTAEQWASNTVPSLVINGSKSPASMHRAAAALAAVLPNAGHRTLAGLNHSAPVMAPKALAPVLREFFTTREQIG